jgi:hypothetical protein
MDVRKMLSLVQQAQLAQSKAQGEIDPQKRLPQEYAELQQKLAALFANLKQTDATTTFSDYQATLAAFLTIALNYKWGYQLLIDQKLEEKLNQQQLKVSTEQVYLTLVELLSRSYQEKNQAAFVHAWHIFIKFGLTDLKINFTKILSQLA